MKNEISEYRKRWALVNAAEIQELRRTSLSEKARQTAALMESARSLGWMERLDLTAGGPLQPDLSDVAPGDGA
jgi:hypothetical protein